MAEGGGRLGTGGKDRDRVDVTRSSYSKTSGLALLGSCSSQAHLEPVQGGCSGQGAS